MKIWIFKMSVAVTAAALTLAILEGSARLFFPPIPDNLYPGLAPGEVADDRLLWRNRPGYSADDLEGPIDSHGFRGHEADLTRSPATFRILSIGESTTFGDGVHADLTYSAVLQRLLVAEGFSHAQVLNAGVRGWSTHQVRLYLEQELVQLDPDVLIVYNEINDFLPTTHRTQDIPGAGLNDVEAIAMAGRRAWLNRLARSSRFVTGLQLWRLRSQVSDRVRERAERAHLDVLSQLEFPYSQLPELRRGEARPWMSNPNRLVRLPDDLRERDLRAIVALAQEADIELVLAHPAYRVSRPHRCLLTQIAEESGVPVLEVQARLAASARKQGIRYADYFLQRDIFHPNPEGHRAIAQGLLQILEARNLLPRPSRRRAQRSN